MLGSLSSDLIDLLLQANCLIYMYRDYRNFSDLVL